MKYDEVGTGMLPDAQEQSGPGVQLPVDLEEARLSLINMSVRCKLDGLNPIETAALLGVTVTRVRNALHDPRALSVERHLGADRTGLDTMRAAQAEYRLSRAWEVVDGLLDNGNPWVRLQSAGLVIASARADAVQGGGKIEIIADPDMVFDDQQLAADLQDDAQDDANMGEYGGMGSMDAE